MAFHLPRHISFGLIGGRAVVLDLAADRYLLLGEMEAAALLSLETSIADPDAAEQARRLAARGLVAAGTGLPVRPVRAPELRESALDHPGPITAIGGLEIMRRRFAASATLWMYGLSGAVARWRRMRAALDHGSRVTNGQASAACARGFAAGRLFVPARRRCVPDSLALACCLWRRGARADLYFGVRLDPFAAHCWVQIDDILLSDPFDIVREFTPVFRL